MHVVVVVVVVGGGGGGGVVAPYSSHITHHIRLAITL